MARNAKQLPLAVGTAAELIAGPALLDGQIGYATDSIQFRVGDGSTAWGSLDISADVTDAANVTAAGALMDSECASLPDVKALNQSVISGATPTFTTTNFTDATNKRLLTDAQEALVDAAVQPSDSGVVLNQIIETINDDGNLTGSVAAVDVDFGGKGVYRRTVTGALSGTFNSITGLGGTAVGDTVFAKMELIQDGGGGNALSLTSLLNGLGTIVGDAPVVNANTAGGTVTEVYVEGEVTSIGPVAHALTFKVGEKNRLAIETYTGTAKTWNSDGVNDGVSYIIFSNASAKTFQPASTEGMLQGEVGQFFNTGAGDLTVSAGSGITLLGDGVFPQNKGGSIVWASTTVGHIIGGTTA